MTHITITGLRTVCGNGSPDNAIRPRQENHYLKVTCRRCLLRELAWMERHWSELRQETHISWINGALA